MDVRPCLRIHIIFPGAACHRVAVNVDRIDRIAYGNLVVDGEDIAYIAAVAFRAIGDEYLVDINVDPARLEVVFQNSLAQEIVALLGAVTLECGRVRLLVDCFMHGLDHSRNEPLGDIADA